jgi:hypothetical protein
MRPPPRPRAAGQRGLPGLPTSQGSKRVRLGRAGFLSISVARTLPPVKRRKLAARGISAAARTRKFSQGTRAPHFPWRHARRRQDARRPRGMPRAAGDSPGVCDEELRRRRPATATSRRKRSAASNPRPPRGASPLRQARARGPGFKLATPRRPRPPPIARGAHAVPQRPFGHGGGGGDAAARGRRGWQRWRGYINVDSSVVVWVGAARCLGYIWAI